MRKIKHLLAGLALLAVAAGCGGPALLVTRAEVQAPGAARVILTEQKGDFFSFTVYNQSPDFMVVNRNAVRLATSAGMRDRLPGGLMDLYNIPPGGAHKVNVKFPLSGLRPGETVWVHFQEAITIHGQPIPIEPVAFAVQ